MDRNYTTMDKNSNLSNKKYNFKNLRFFELMQKETKLQQKLFDKETLIWKNEGHAQNG